MGCPDEMGRWRRIGSSPTCSLETPVGEMALQWSSEWPRELPCREQVQMTGERARDWVLDVQRLGAKQKGWRARSVVS